MKYNPKKLTYGDALRISTTNMTVTVEDENRQHVTGKLKHIGPNDALAGDNLALRDLIALALIITDNEYFVVCDDDERILCPAIRFDRDLNVTWNTIISIEENPDDGEELDFAELKTKLVKDETPTADVEPVRHGRWIDGNCSVCAVPAVTLRQADGVELRVETPRCPNCGARMDGESEERK